MERILDKLKLFEKRNNISAFIELMSDGSGSVKEFWDDEELTEFKTIEELDSFLTNTQYQLDENGVCISPVQVI